jgi:heme-degrading monooxygenase HmoA
MALAVRDTSTQGEIAMTYLIVRHTVENYDPWKAAFDAHASYRQAQGSQGGTLLRNTANPHELLIVLEWKDLESAQAFAESAELRAAMEGAGVTGQPDLWFAEELDRPQA